MNTLIKMSTARTVLSIISSLTKINESRKSIHDNLVKPTRNIYSSDGESVKIIKSRSSDRACLETKEFDSKGYNIKGLDRSNYSREYYSRIVSEMIGKHDTAYRQMKLDNYNYALHDIRIGIEMGIKASLAHKLGKGYEDNWLRINIKICLEHEIFTKEFIKKIQSAVGHCNDVLHYNDPERSVKEYRQVHFCYKVLEELTEQVRNLTYACEEE